MNNIFALVLSLSVVAGSANAQKRQNPGSQIPILAWYSIPASETSIERYQEMKDAGITYSLSFFPNLEALQKALEAAAKVGIKMIANCPELKSDPEKTVKSLMNNPAVAGYHLMDEPGISLFSELGKWCRKIQAVDSKHFCYVNLFPNFADSALLGTKSYLKYVRACSDSVPLRFLSFDYYPVLKDRLSKTWYENLEQFSSESKKAGKPFWAFALTTNYDDGHITPQTLAAMRLQVYSDLAYGAQGIQYFTYWSATSVSAPSSEDQRGAPITATGKRSVVYDRVKQMSEEVKNLSGVFLDSKMVWVRHAGKSMIPTGTVRLTDLPEPVKVLDANGAPILVSLLENGDFNYLVVVNKDFQNSINFTFYGDDTVKKILKDGTQVPANTYEPSMELDPGDAAIYQFPKAKSTFK